MRTKSPKTGQEKIYDMVTNAILDRLDKGEIPWQKPWKSMPGAGSIPMNLVSKKSYRGINVILLGMQGFDSPYWLTFKQAKSLKGSDKKGERGTAIVFWKWFDKKEKDEVTGEEKMGRYAMLRYYTVFNSEQCEGLKSKALDAMAAAAASEEPEEEPDAIEVCEQVWADYSRKPKLHHRGNSASYSPKADRIQMPKKAAFNSMEEYYSTLFHEAIHSTGHEDRLNREGVAKMNGFGTKRYSKEELVAEFGSAFLCGVTGISPKVIDNQAAYIKGWSKKIKEDRTLVVKAAGAAQKAADWVLIADTHFKE